MGHDDRSLPWHLRPLDDTGATVADGTYVAKVVGGKVTGLSAVVPESLPVSLIDAKGDLIVGTADNVATRKAVGADGKVLTADSTQATGVIWASPASGFADPTTTKGDLIVHGASTTRLAVGGDGLVLTADSTQATGVAWASAKPTFPLDPTSLHATYGDHFAGASLDAKWTRVGYTSAYETYQQGGGTWLVVPTCLASTNYWYQSAPSGDFSIVMKAFCTHANSVMFGLMIADNTGAGIGLAPYNSPDSALTVPLTAAAYSGSGASGDGTPTNAVSQSGVTCWYKITKVSTTYSGYFSTNGITWRANPGNVIWAGTPTRIGFGGFLGTARQFGIDFFDVQ